MCNGPSLFIGRKPQTCYNTVRDANQESGSRSRSCNESTTRVLYGYLSHIVRLHPRGGHYAYANHPARPL